MERTLTLIVNETEEEFNIKSEHKDFTILELIGLFTLMKKQMMETMYTYNKKND